MSDFRAPRPSRSNEEFRPRRERSEREFEGSGRGSYAAHRPSRMAQRSANVDPFFDKPYVASSVAEPAAWDSRATPVKASTNIKPKRKIAALFKAPVAAS